MRIAAFAPFFLVLQCLFASAAHAGPTPDAATAAQRLSLYAPGRMPAERTVLTALTTLERHGTRQDVSLLRNIAELESAEVATAAQQSISAIRNRQLAEQGSASTERPTAALPVQAHLSPMDRSAPEPCAGDQANQDDVVAQSPPMVIDARAVVDTAQRGQRDRSASVPERGACALESRSAPDFPGPRSNAK
ncbi:MAG: hypothetical protein ACI9MC_000481 [Kiritimatiellia bacterium]|jgi:hypothetical protein